MLRFDHGRGSRRADGFTIRTGGGRTAMPHHQTLRAAIEWSYDLLNEGEKQLFRRLAVFMGGRSLEAIEAVCNAGGDLELDALDGVESLVRLPVPELPSRVGVEGAGGATESSVISGTLAAADWLLVVVLVAYHDSPNGKCPCSPILLPAAPVVTRTDKWSAWWYVVVVPAIVASSCEPK